jgi:hypothetical protein
MERPIIYGVENRWLTRKLLMETNRKIYISNITFSGGFHVVLWNSAS